MVAKHEKHDMSFYSASSPTSGTFDSICVSTDKRTPESTGDPSIRGLSPRQSRLFSIFELPNNSLSPHS